MCVCVCACVCVCVHVQPSRSAPLQPVCFPMPVKSGRFVMALPVSLSGEQGGFSSWASLSD